MSGNLSSEVRDIAVKYALKNAIEHDGKAVVKSVLSKLLGSLPELRPRAKELESIVSEVVSYINSMNLDEQVRLAMEKYPEILEDRGAVSHIKTLPPLPNVEKYKGVRTRFAPNPDFLIHLGNARPAILSYEYAKMYNGRLILRFEDTDPRTKQPMPEAYSAIKEDLKWLGVKWDEEYIQSLRMELYYTVAKELISVGGAYVDLCGRDDFMKYKIEMRSCPHRESPIETNLELWDKMLSGYFKEGEAVVRVKTDLLHPDPSVRDWVAFRILDTDKNPHPIVGSKYILWPTYNYAASVDDHLMSVTHILRGKEHMVNTIKQRYLYGHLGWDYPEVINLGRLRLEGFILSKSKIKELVSKYPKKFRSIDDIRFGTIASLRKRGIIPETIRKVILEVGTKVSDASISWENIAAINRKLIDPVVKRLMFVSHPSVKVSVRSVPPNLTKISVPLHPTNKSLGHREILLDVVDGCVSVLLDKADVDRLRSVGYVRLMELMNIKYVDETSEGVIAEFVSTELGDAKKLRASIVHWVPYSRNVRALVVRPKDLNLLRVRGYGEEYMKTLKVGETVQLVRYGFAKVSDVRRDAIELIFIHE